MSITPTVDKVFRTLADPTRRAVFERIFHAKEITVAELTRDSGVTQGAISQHLKTLKLAGLVTERPRGGMSIIDLSRRAWSHWPTG